MNTGELFPTLALPSGLRSKRNWTEREEAILLEMRTTHTNAQIAALIGRTRRAVAHRFQKDLRVRKLIETDYSGVPATVLSYTAGIIDGEGHIGIACSRGKYRLTVEVSNTSRRLVEFLKLHFGGNLTTGCRPNRKPYHRWMVTTNMAGRFLESVLPYLVVKKDQAELGLAFRTELDISKRPGMYEKMKALHRYD